MPPGVIYVSIAVLAVVFVLSILARRFPHIDWLQHFRSQRPYDPERDRHLDTAWMQSAGITPKRGPVRDTVDEIRKEFREFRAAMPELPKEEKIRMRRRTNVYAGVQLILLGVALPFGLQILKIMTFFSSTSRTEHVLVFAASGICIALGITAILRSRKD